MTENRANEIIDNKDKSRFELDIDGQIVFADYRIDGKTLIINHVESPLALRGSGAAGKLMQGITALARKDNHKIHPVCSYAVHWLQRHEDAQDLTI